MLAIRQLDIFAASYLELIIKSLKTDKNLRAIERIENQFFGSYWNR